MNLYLRLLRMLFTSLWKPREDPSHEVISRFRVWPHDLDVFGHMNNGRYLQIMDVARVDWMRRTRILDAIVEQRCGALLGGVVARFCRSLSLFEPYCVHTSLVAWESRWAFLQHRFTTPDGELIAVGYTRAALRNQRGWVTPQQILDRIRPGMIPTDPPPLVKQWLAVDDGLVEARSFSHLAAPRTSVMNGPSPVRPEAPPFEPSSLGPPPPSHQPRG